MREYSDGYCVRFVAATEWFVFAGGVAMVLVVGVIAVGVREQTLEDPSAAPGGLAMLAGLTLFALANCAWALPSPWRNGVWICPTEIRVKRAFAKEARIPIAEVERFEARVITGGVGQDVIVLLRGEKHWVRTPLGEIRFGRVVAPLNEALEAARSRS